MKTYVITISDRFGFCRKTTVRAKSPQEATSAVYTDDSEFVTSCYEI